jgi:hypothetical protein
MDFNFTKDKTMSHNLFNLTKQKFKLVRNGNHKAAAAIAVAYKHA